MKPTIEEMLFVLDVVKFPSVISSILNANDYIVPAETIDAIKRLILAVGEWKTEAGKLLNGRLWGSEPQGSTEFIRIIRDFGDKEPDRVAFKAARPRNFGEEEK